MKPRKHLGIVIKKYVFCPNQKHEPLIAICICKWYSAHETAGYEDCHGCTDWLNPIRVYRSRPYKPKRRYLRRA